MVSSKLPEGIYLLSDGQFVTVLGNIAITGAPAFADSLTLINSLVDWGINFRILNDYRWTVDLGDNNPIVTGMIGYGELALNANESSANGSLERSEIYESEYEYSLPVDFKWQRDEENPANKDYSLQVIFQNSLIQVIPPAIYALKKLTELMETSGIKYSINRNSGVIIIEDIWYFKPDYVLNKFNNADDLKYWEDNKDDYGIAWKQGDFNQDGILDLEMYTSEGRQIIYELKP